MCKTFCRGSLKRRSKEEVEVMLADCIALAARDGVVITKIVIDDHSFAEYGIFSICGPYGVAEVKHASSN